MWEFPIEALPAHNNNTNCTQIQQLDINIFVCLTSGLKVTYTLFFEEKYVHNMPQSAWISAYTLGPGMVPNYGHIGKWIIVRIYLDSSENLISNAKQVCLKPRSKTWIYHKDIKMWPFYKTLETSRLLGRPNCFYFPGLLLENLAKEKRGEFLHPLLTVPNSF